MAKPIIKWVGGKRQLLRQLKESVNRETVGEGTYYEPFIGGGALAFDLAIPGTHINDMNEELINLYEVVRDEPEKLISNLAEHERRFAEDPEGWYGFIRGLDRTGELRLLDKATQAARTVFLNKTCFNGLYRVNSEGYFNVGLGKSSSGKAPEICDAEAISRLSEVLKAFVITQGDYRKAICGAKEGDLVYLDPPYDYEPSAKSKYVGYQKSGWTREDTEALAAECRRLDAAGVRFVVSNNDTAFVRSLFAGYRLIEVQAARAVNSDGAKRGKVAELIIRNF